MKKIEVPAQIDELDKVLAFVEETMEEADCSMKIKIQLNIAVEEIYVNIAHYAYPDGEGMAAVELQFNEDPAGVTITFLDEGIPYNPLQKEDPDVTLDAAERQIGGLGIFMVKKSMDDMQYEYKDNKNILKITKNF